MNPGQSPLIPRNPSRSGMGRLVSLCVLLWALYLVIGTAITLRVTRGEREKDESREIEGKEESFSFEG
eukprot:1331971-Amorphochlora_amoeboformis.AAC.2